MTTPLGSDTMSYYLMQGFNLIAYVPSDASRKTLNMCDNLRKRLVHKAIFPDGIVVDRCLGGIDGGKSDD